MLDEVVHAKILAYVTEHKASLSCQAWKEFLYDSLHLQCRIRFNQKLAEGPVAFSYNAVRPLGEDFEESVSYNFEFAPGGTYTMQWHRTFDAWSSQSEQHFGSWRFLDDKVQCETLEPKGEVNDKEVRFAPPGYKFSVLVEDILIAPGLYFQEKIGAPPKSWELAARLGRPEKETVAQCWQMVTEAEATQPDTTGYPLAQESSVPIMSSVHEDTRFVEIDGEMHEVSGDIVKNCPEQQWKMLMQCRLRFGINGMS